MKKYFLLIAVVLIIAVVATAYKVKRNYATQIETNSTYAIQNVKTGKNLRPYNAGVEDDNKIVLYNHHKWKCMTWQFIHVEGETHQLKNLYTSKTFQPSSKPESGATLCQQPLVKDSLQYWEFIKQPDNIYLIRLKGTALYITISSDKTNSNIILMPKQSSAEQEWRLIEQHPLF